MDSQLSSPDVPEPQLTAAIFSSPIKPGRSVLTPARKNAVVEHREARRRSAKGLVNAEDDSDEREVEEATRGRSAYTARSIAGWESDDDEMPEFSPPKTMRFEFGENRIIQTPGMFVQRSKSHFH
jgi:DASH complex subunit ASK1